jgi:N-acetyl-alpha-D-muramate 1-phosphate uridylyltransferase
MRKAMIMAAGYGTRMRELTQVQPKPLLEAGGKSLIEHTLLRLSQAGFDEIVINVSWLGELIKKRLGDGSRYDVSIQYSDEAEPLEWAGGIVNALPMLGNEPFLAISADLWTDYPFEHLKSLQLSALAHLVLIHRSAFRSDFTLTNQDLVTQDSPAHTYGGIGLFHPDIFKGMAQGKCSFGQVMLPLVKNKQVSGEIFDGAWFNIGTPEDLADLDQWLNEK